MSDLTNINQYSNVDTTSAIAPVGSDAVSGSQAASGESAVMHHQEPVANANSASPARAQGSLRPASPSHASSTGASASGYSGSSAHSASLSQAGPSAGSHAEPAMAAAPGQVELSAAVQEFLAKPVAGPYRPIFFDLETTGRHLFCCWDCMQGIIAWLVATGCMHRDCPTLLADVTLL